MKSLSEMNCTLAWYICLDDNGKDVATEIIKEIFIDDDRVDVSVLADDVMALEITSIMRKSSLQFWWCLLVCFHLKYAEYQHYKCHCQKTRLCTTGSYRYDKIAVAKVQQSESFIYLVGSFIGSCILGIPIGLLLCTQISKIPGLSYFEYHFPVLFVLLYFAAVVMVYHVVSVYQRNLCNSTQL